MSGCHRVWRHRIETEILPSYPNVLIVQARAYGVPKVMDRADRQGSFTIPAVEPDPRGFPLRYVRKFLVDAYGPGEGWHDLVIMFHPNGGFSWTRQSTS